MQHVVPMIKLSIWNWKKIRRLRNQTGIKGGFLHRKNSLNKGKEDEMVFVPRNKVWHGFVRVNNETGEVSRDQTMRKFHKLC